MLARERVEQAQTSEQVTPSTALINPEKGANVRIFYATDRLRSKPTPSGLSYDGQRAHGGSLALGTALVTIPPRHRKGDLERPSLVHFEFSEDPAKHVTLQRVQQQSFEEFYRQLRGTASSSREVFVFVHGFGVSFEDALLRTGQLKYDLEFPGTAIAYTWPSNGSISLADYRADGEDARWSAEHLRWFLADVVAKSGAEKVHVLAHSMGNQVVTAAIRAANPARAFLQNIVLMAPDIDADLLTQAASALGTSARRVTLYASANDEALEFSRKYNGHPRAGDTTGGIFTAEAFESIDASATDTSLIGHWYYAERESVLADVFYLFSKGLPAAQRFGLRPNAGPPPWYVFAR